ncbi:MAG: serine hydrolase domain-containing protein [Bacteroidota bacterium]|nr:serine hydrolase domain-containing protein [Bacteroidota bacterium]
MKKYHRLTGFIILIVCSIILSSCTATSTLSPEQSIDNIMSDYNSPYVPGASVLVMKNDTIIFKKAYGSANLEESRAVTTATNFRLASITKEFTAMCILILQEQGKLSFDDKLVTFFPDLPLYGKDITARNLLNHTSGLVDYEDFVPASQTYQVLDRDCLELLKKTDTLYFSPGTTYQYSNTGYAFLALIVEKVSGKRFADFLKENIFDKVGMPTSVAFENGLSTVSNRAYGHSLNNGTWIQTDQSNTSAVLGDGGIYSNVEEMAMWISTLWNYKLISPQTQQLAWSDATLNDGTPIDYGMGWHIETYSGIRHPHHGGSTRGFRNHILVFPEQKILVIVLTNRNQGDPIVQAHAIADLYLNEK